MKKFIEGPYYKLLAVVLALSLTSLCIPIGSIQIPIHRHLAPPKAAAPDSRTLTSNEMDLLSGKTNPNAYVAGSNAFSVMHSEVDVTTGNYMHTETDWAVQSSIGIPANVTRTYSANNPDEGPFGWGWTLSVDMRSTVGGLLKGPGMPSRAVPVQFREQPPAGANDPHYGNATPVSSLTATDASGYQECVQVDADGILSTPAWDRNVIEREYETVVVEDQTYWVTTGCTVLTPEGTTYVYEKKGEYPDGAYALDANGEQTGDPVPSNVLKVTSITDRQGNVTSFSYSGTNDYVSFEKANGDTSEAKLESISTPDGRELNFTWGETTEANRIVQIDDGTGRHVDYDYDGSANGIELISFTSAGEKVTQYDYSGLLDPNVSIDYDLLCKITDPRGLETTIHYCEGGSAVTPYEIAVSSVFCYRIEHPNDVSSFFVNEYTDVPTGGPYYGYSLGPPRFQDAFLDGSTWVKLCEGEIDTAGASGTPPVVIQTVSDPTPPGGPAAALYSYRQVNAFTHDVLVSKSYRPARTVGTLAASRDFSTVVPDTTRTETASVYNFLGLPLIQESSEFVGQTGGSATRTTRTETAYWGADKYFQRKASVTTWPNTSEPAAISFTDYYDDQASTGKGLPHLVYDSVNATFSNSSGSGWRDAIAVSGGDETASFEYDSMGRPTHVYKISKDGGSNDSIETAMSYGSLSSPYWGGAIEVDEDTQGANRVTSTLEYDSMGRALEVEDAAGHVFVTTYSDDGEIENVTVDDDPVVSYTYGTGTATGQPTLIEDCLTERWQSFTYGSDSQRPWELGVLVGTAEGKDGESAIYTTAYQYYVSGLRAQTTYTTPNGTTRWAFGDYIRCGNPLQGALAFQTMVQLDTYGDPKTNEFHYAYDQSGRLVEAAFAQTPTQTSASNGSWYSQDPALYRAHVVYDYDEGGRCSDVFDFWDTWYEALPAGYYVTAKLLRQGYAYDAKGQRSAQDFYHGASGSWVSDRTETYEYDAQRGFLTAVDYDDGLAGETPSWTYDLAGNRSTSGQSAWTYDDLNRLVSGGGYTYESDIMGNRTWRNYGQSGVQRYVYDVLNRCTSVCGASDGARYEYRPDGLRVEKVSGLSITWNPEDEEHASGWYDENWSVNKETTRYYYDGQKCFEEDNVEEQAEVVNCTRYGLGARGIDWIETSVSGNPQTSLYPLYDGHGNMIATISLSGDLSNLRAYDAWGGVRAQAGVTTDPNTRYCANLGHKQDDESGLIYMRARFYDAGTGRFISEDPARDGSNWFAYCNNDPVNRIDGNGANSVLENQYFNLMFALGVNSMFLAFVLAVPVFGGPATKLEQAGAIAALVLAAAFMSEALGQTSLSTSRFNSFFTLAGAFIGAFASIALGIGNAKWVGRLEKSAVFLAALYSVACLGLIIGMDNE